MTRLKNLFDYTGSSFSEAASSPSSLDGQFQLEDEARRFLFGYDFATLQSQLHLKANTA